MIDWHRLFGLALTDLFTGSPYEVELEKDLSLRQQFLDVVIIRKTRGQWSGILPDGLDNLAKHNLITYKSLREPLNVWALQELVGHYVNYRKQISGKKLLPAVRFKLYAVATRFPRKLANQTKLEELQQGVYQIDSVTGKIRIIVLSEIAQAEHNSLWLIFSGVTDLIDWGAVHYHTNTQDMSSIINRLFNGYRLEGIKVSYTIKDFRLDVARECLHELPYAELLGAVPPEERLRGLQPETILRGLSAEDVAKLKLLLQESPKPAH